MFVEAVSSNHELVSAIKSCGVIKPHGVVEFKVKLRRQAILSRSKVQMYVSVLIGNAKVDVAVNLVN
jgi:hypothetical protein